jgi:hypothetical protein
MFLIGGINDAMQGALIHTPNSLPILAAPLPPRSHQLFGQISPTGPFVANDLLPVD